MYFIRTEESPQDAQASLQRGRSVSRWNTAGWKMIDHLRYYYEHGSEDHYQMISRLCEAWELPVPQNDADLRAILDEIGSILLGDDEAEEEAARILGFERFENGWAKFLDGLCALQKFESQPSPDDVTATLPHGELFRYLVCYEGEQTGWDYADGGWPLFRPIRIVWVHDRGADAPASCRERD